MADDILVFDNDEVNSDEENYEISPYTLSKYKDQYAIMSNYLAQAMEKTNLLESKIELLAINYLNKGVKQTVKIDPNGNKYNVNYVIISSSDIRALTGRQNSGSLYEQMKGVAIALKRKIHLIEDEKKKGFRAISMYGDVAMENGKLYIEFNTEAEFLFLGLSKDFAQINLEIAFAFKSNGGLQLYKAFTSHIYKLEPIDLTKKQEELPYLEISYTVPELRLTLGYVDLTQKNIELEAQKKHPNFEKMSEMDKKPKYKRWVDFYKRVIEPGVKEINKISDIYIKEVECVKVGRGGKIENVIFRIQRNKKYHENSKTTERGMDFVTKTEDGNDIVEPHFSFTAEQIESARDIMSGYSLSDADIELLLKEADGDFDLLERVYKLSRQQSHIRNLMAWLRSAIRDNYDDSQSVAYGSEEKGEFINNYKENGPSDEVKQAVWERFKKKEDFGKFLEESGVAIEVLELLEVDERIELYSDFKNKGK